MKREFIIVVVLFVVALFLRLYALDRVPPSPSLDEVSIGYNAYSLLKAGVDEYGQQFPLLLRAYDDFRPALFVYMVWAFIPIVGLSVWAVRLPAVICSLVTLYYLYQTARLLSYKIQKPTGPALWALAFGSVCAWLVYLSRLGHEVNLGLTLFTLGMYQLLVWILHKKSTALVFSALWFAISLYGYQSEKLIVPLVLGYISIFYYKRLIQGWRYTLLAAFVFIAVSLPAVVATLTPEGMSRFAGTSALHKDSEAVRTLTEEHAQAVGRGDRVVSVWTSKYVIPMRIVGANYISHFAPGWLFDGNARENHKIPHTGLFFEWQLPLLLVGIWFVWKKLPRDVAMFLSVWVLSGPLPAAFTTQAPHAMRAFTSVVPLVIFMGFGAYVVATGKWRVWTTGFLCVALLVSTLAISKHYFYTFPATQSDSFQYALHKAIDYAHEHKEDYSTVHVTNQGAGYQSYMFYLYATGFDPQKYQHLGGTTSGGYNETHDIENMRFYDLSHIPDMKKGELYIVEGNLLPNGARVTAEFANLDGKIALRAISL